MSSIKKILVSIALFAFSLVCVVIVAQGSTIFSFLQFPGLAALIVGFFVMFAGILEPLDKK